MADMGEEQASPMSWAFPAGICHLGLGVGVETPRVAPVVIEGASPSGWAWEHGERGRHAVLSAPDLPPPARSQLQCGMGRSAAQPFCFFG